MGLTKKKMLSKTLTWVTNEAKLDSKIFQRPHAKLATRLQQLQLKEYQKRLNTRKNCNFLY